MARVVVVGLDSLAPELVFDRFAARLPTFAALAAEGVAAPLLSSIPPITVPAWAAMMTGVDPGTLGLYGFRQKRRRDYSTGVLASSLSHDVPTIWDEAGRQGLRSRVLGVPPTYPPKPVRGELVTGCLTPGTDVVYTYPPELALEVEATTGGYLVDVPDFRAAAPERVLEDIQIMTTRRFRLARSWLEKDDWDLFVMVEMGSDRLQHRFWDEPETVGAYYETLDRELGELAKRLRPDDVLLVVSDHGAQPMRGALALNDLLRQAGYLVLRPEHPPSGRLEPAHVDWEQTRAWAEGGYVGRIYANVAGREPRGIVAPDALGELLEALARLVGDLAGPDGQHVPVEVLRPADVYREVRGIAPDLMLYVGDLGYRTLATVGHPSLWERDNDRGIDRANHARHGVFIAKDGRGKRTLPFAPTLYDVAPTVLDRLGVAVPPRMQGRVVV